MISQNISNQLSRRKWLRDAAIATTGAAVLPSLLTSCTDHPVNPGIGLVGGASAPSDDVLYAKAAQNLHNMKEWLKDLHSDQDDYERDMLDLLKSGKERLSGWSEFAVNIVLDILVGGITAAGVLVETVTGGVASAGLVAMFSITSELIKKFGIEESKRDNLSGVFGEFKTAQDSLFRATRDLLTTLAGDADNYGMLRKNWNEEFEFNGKKYAYRDLATMDFPSDKTGAVYVQLGQAAFTQFKILFWNVMFIKAGKMSYSLAWQEAKVPLPSHSPFTHEKDDFYKLPWGKAQYLRGWKERDFSLWFRRWYWTFDDIELPDSIAMELFKDDYPENIINPDALFNRDYVFKQFHQEKPNFFGYHDVNKKGREHINGGLDPDGDDYPFTGGNFPQLIKK